jgi:prepilin-type N-terminal cleavage/methylation domain-containing protein
MKVQQKRSFTLLEIMIAIFLIGIIGSVIGYNMKGALDKGKVFRTEQAMRQMDDVLSLMLAEGATTPLEINENLPLVLEKSGLFKKASEIAKDGWGAPFMVSVDPDYNIKITSENYENKIKKKGK